VGAQPDALSSSPTLPDPDGRRRGPRRAG
jgi:hypothetical protein